MAEFRFEDKDDIKITSLAKLKSMILIIESLSYEDKCIFIEVLVQYLFAYYAELGKRDGIWVKIVVKDLFCKYTNRKEMILFLRDLVDARNEVSHA